MYSVLGATLAWGSYRSHGHPGDIWLLLAGALYGLSDEIHQMYVPGRSPDPADLAADVVGLLLGYGTTRAILGRTTDEHDPAGTAAGDERDAC
ncbi:MAG: VanZ family protein [Gemmatimonadetes bacterium]|nr:VanZ family protein [Gemmatimonadota bacterium]NNF14442.1 VanZ family protein [Gemmatimonadota bacterium]NNL30688.1 VanZ family protein [Gemmatimonadota bacterium]